MTDQLAEWVTRLNTVGPISYPEQQALVALAVGFRADRWSWRRRAEKWEDKAKDLTAENARLREGLNAAGDMLARVMEADAVPGTDWLPCCSCEQGCAEAGCTCFCHDGKRP